MALRINTNISSLQAQRALEKNTLSTQSSFEKLSSGLRINKAADDAAGLAVSETLNAKIRGLDQAKRNANDAISLVQVAEGSMSEMSNILTRMRELTVQAASDTIGDKERSFLNKEYTQLVEEFDRIANTTEFNGMALFNNNERSEFAIQVGINSSKAADNKDVISIKTDGLKLSSTSLGFGKGAEIGPVDPTGTGPARDVIASRLDTIDSAMDALSTQRAYLGATQNRLESAISNLGVSIENSAAAKSRIVDTDYAAETAKLTQSQIVSQASISVLAQANSNAQSVLTLLK